MLRDTPLLEALLPLPPPMSLCLPLFTVPAHAPHIHLKETLERKDTTQEPSPTHTHVNHTCVIWVSFRENEKWRIYIYKVIEMLHIGIAKTPQRFKLSPSYFEHVVPHHFSLRKSTLVSYSCSLPMLQSTIPRGVQNPGSSLQECPNCFKIDMHVKDYWFLQIVEFYHFRYGDTAMQSKSTFPARIAPFSVPELLPFSR